MFSWTDVNLPSNCPRMSNPHFVIAAFLRSTISFTFLFFWKVPFIICIDSMACSLRNIQKLTNNNYEDASPQFVQPGRMQLVAVGGGS